MKNLLLCITVLLSIISSLSAFNGPRPNIKGPNGLWVNSYYGNLYLLRTDHIIPGDGFPIDCSFTYNSGNADQNTGYGYGWNFTFNLFYETDTNGIVIQRANGSRELYTLDQGAYIPPPGVFDELTEYQAGKYRLKDKYGLLHYFDNAQHKKLTRIVDHNGNTLSLTYTNDKPTTITDNSGRSIQLSWASKGLVKITDNNLATQRELSYQYDSEGNLSHATDFAGSTVEYLYGSDHEMTGIRDKKGNTTTITYRNGTVVREVISCQTHQTFSYNPNASKTYLVEKVDGESQMTVFAFDQDGRVTEVTYPDGTTNNYAYDADNNVISFKDERGGNTQYTHDQYGNILTETDALGNARARQYHPQHCKVLSSTDKMGNETAFQYDANGNLTQIDLPDGTKEEYSYDNTGRIIAFTDAKGNNRTFGYDSYGNLTSIVYPIGQETFTYDAAGNRSSYTDRNGETTYYDYNSRDELVSLTDPNGDKILFTYDENGNINGITDKAGNQINRSFDEINRLISIESINNFVTYDLNSKDNVKEISTAAGPASTISYNEQNLPKQEVDPLGNVTAYEFDDNANLVALTDPDGYRTEYSYDALNRLNSVLLPVGSTQYSYNNNGRLTAKTNADGNTYGYAYNQRNYLSSEADPAGNQIVYTYDANGNRKSETLPNGDVINYSYDAMNRLTSRSYRGNTDNYTYDLRGNLITASNNDISISYSYDKLNRLETQTINTWSKTTEYGYDKLNNVTSMRDPDNGVTSYSYDEDSRLLSVTDPELAATSFTYDAAGRVIRTDFANGSSAFYTYDAADRLLNVEHKNSSSGDLSTIAYTHDGRGNRLTASNAGGTESYEYDASSRLTKATYGDGSTQEYEYSPTGNRTTLNNNGQAIAYSYDNTDRLLSAGSTTYTYDANGNLKSKTLGGSTTNYDYDGLNRLVSITYANGASQSFSYDPHGNRIATVDTGGIETRFVYDGNNILLQLDAQNNTQVRYTTGLQLDDWISQRRNGQTYYYHRDALSNVKALTDQNQTVVKTYTYDVYGKIRSESGNVENTMTFTSREYDKVSGLYYLRARYYDPETGRFISKDRFQGFMHDPLTINKYAYAVGNPTNLIDPEGTIAFIPILIFAGKALAVGGAAYAGYSAGNAYQSRNGDWHQGRNRHNQLPDGNLTPVDGASPDFTHNPDGSNTYRDESGREWTLLPDGKNIFHQPEPGDPGYDPNNPNPNKKLLSPDGGSGSYEAILQPDGNGGYSDNYLTNGPKQGTYNYYHPDGIGGNLGHFFLDIAPHLWWLGGTDEYYDVPIIRSRDPNEMIGPPGYGDEHFVAQSATLPYTILFENDPDFATASAQIVTVTHKIDPSLNLFSFRLSDFGFGDFTFEVPPNSTFYSDRLDVSDSLGVFVDVTAGINVNANEVFWIFESIDPATGLAPTGDNVALGFLLVNDTVTRRGEGFVSFSIRPKNSSATGDSIIAIADIVFDDNEHIETPKIFNIIDAGAPVSTVNPLPAVADSTSFEIHWTASDDQGGSGVSEFDLYVSADNGPFEIYQQAIQDTFIEFVGESGKSYEYFVVARDNVGNQEPAKSASEASTSLSGLNLAIKVYLQGTYQHSDSLMSDELRNKGYLPTEEPYTALGFPRVEHPGSETIDPQLFVTADENAIVDWIFVELRDKGNPANIVASRAALLQRDGDIVDLDGTGNLAFSTMAADNYYIAVRHRNHLGVMTANSIAMASDTVTHFDFTDTSALVYGTEAMNTDSGVASLWSGNITHDGVIKYAGSNNDRDPILVKIGGQIPSAVVFGYHLEDINLDGVVKYGGINNDRDPILRNIGGNVATNTRLEQLAE